MTDGLVKGLEQAPEEHTISCHECDEDQPDDPLAGSWEFVAGQSDRVWFCEECKGAPRRLPTGHEGNSYPHVKGIQQLTGGTLWAYDGGHVKIVPTGLYGDLRRMHWRELGKYVDIDGRYDTTEGWIER